MERTRSIKVEAQNGGTPCESTEEEQACGMEDCDKACVLSDWSAFSSCSKACGGGTLRRTKEVLEPSRGQGECPAPDDEHKRIGFVPCNNFPCEELLPPNRNILECNSKIDLIILLDGSGSLGEFGWDQSKQMAQKMVENLQGGTDKVKVALQVFSGPSSWSDYEKCTSELPPGETLDIQTQCGIEWVSHFTDDTGALATEVQSLAWPAATTLTSVALGQAENELIYGREDANSVVVVITDGMPMNQISTTDAARELQKKARCIWVPVGSGAPEGLISSVASKPQKENIVKIANFWQMTQPVFLNEIISDACPMVQ